MAFKYALHRGPSQDAVLHQLIQTRAGWAPGTYTLFFLSGEGQALPKSQPGDDIEELSGYALGRRDDLYYFWLGWDASAQEPALVIWEPAQPQPHWARSAEYRRARERVGLSA
jgi:hypothetical protein